MYEMKVAIRVRELVGVITRVIIIKARQNALIQISTEHSIGTEVNNDSEACETKWFAGEFGRLRFNQAVAIH